MKRNKATNPYNDKHGKTEWAAVAVLMHWMRNIIEDKNIDLGLPDIETKDAKGKRCDMTIYESRRSRKPLCVIEAKRPYFIDVFNEYELKNPAKEKAIDNNAKFFAVTNFKKLLLYSTEYVVKGEPEEKQIIRVYDLSEIENIDQIESPKYSKEIKKELEKFLTDLYLIHTEKKELPKHPVDELLIFRLYEKIKVLSNYYVDVIYNQYHRDNGFAINLRKWFYKQGWTFTAQPADFEKAALQTAYLLINKIIFYKHLQAKRPNELDVLSIPKGCSKGRLLKRFMQIYFDEALEIDYETIFTTDFIDSLAFPDEIKIVEDIELFVEALKDYDFTKLGYDIIGRIFEKLIPVGKRHNLGQYFTNTDIVDLILKFCLKSDTDMILDPSCGAGTFLVRAYQHKKLLNRLLDHGTILNTLWGVEIAKFPAHLATINLAINDLSVDKNYPNIICEDFFEIFTEEDGIDLESWRKKIAKTLSKEEKEIIHPKRFDAIVGNPPYTRQEEIPEIGIDKEKMIKKALQDFTGSSTAEISKRAGIHAYFFVHGTKFLKEGGRFGFIVSNSWLDVDYGKGLQEFFLRNYKILTVIESKAERWFTDADVNTCVIILEKCKDEAEKKENIVRFIYLKKKLTEFIPPAEDIWEKKVERLKVFDKFYKTALTHVNIYEDDYFRIYPRMQEELWKEGYDEEEEKYKGAKWGKYLRAPVIFFDILNKYKNKLIPLKEIAKVRFGIKTGVNKFFYLTEDEIERRKIEKKFTEPVIFSLKELDSYQIQKNSLKYKAIICHKSEKELENTNLLKYIKWGERHKLHQRPTCASRNPWYSLAKRWKYAPLIIPAKVGERIAVFLNNNIFEDKKLYGIIPNNKNDKDTLAALLNSTISRLILEFSCRQLTGAQAIADIDVNVVEDLLIVNPKNLTKKQIRKINKSFDKLKDTKVESIFKEIASSPEKISLHNIKKELRDLDRIIMGDILGLTEEEQTEVYRAVVDIVKSRLDRVKSVKKRKKTKNGIDIELFLKDVMSEIGDKRLGNFYKQEISNRDDLITIDLPKKPGDVAIKKGLFGWNLYYSGNKYIECETEEEARYLKLFLDIGSDSVEAPKDKKYLSSIIDEIKELKEENEKTIDYFLNSVASPKTREKLRGLLWSEIMKN